MTNASYTIADLAAFSTAELVAMYNELTSKAIKKFSSRLAGERQILAAQERVLAERAAIQASTAQAVAQAHADHAAEVAAAAPAKKASPGRAANIAKSWANPEVAAARAARATVTVTGPLTCFWLKDGGDTYTSVAAAFKALHLPMGQHIKFRGELKAAGVRMFGEFTFLNNVK